MKKGKDGVPPRYEVVQAPGGSGAPCDIIAHEDGRSLTMLGPGGPRRELAAVEPFLARQAPRDEPQRTAPRVGEALPVLLGAGLGHALGRLLDAWDGPLAVVDKEQDLEVLTGTLAALPETARERVLVVDNPEPSGALAALTRWQLAQGGKPLMPLPLPFYQRLDKAYYGALRDSLSASTRFDFWSRAVHTYFYNNTYYFLHHNNILSI